MQGMPWQVQQQQMQQQYGMQPQYGQQQQQHYMQHAGQMQMQACFPSNLDLFSGDLQITQSSIHR